MKVLAVNQQAGPGGASGICLALHRSLVAAGHDSAVMVGRLDAALPCVGLIEHDRYRSGWGRFWMAMARRLRLRGDRIAATQHLSARWLPALAAPQRVWSYLAGHEDFDFPGTARLLEQAPFRPDVLHFHNLHSYYFDLRELPRISKSVPTVITLHDAWLLAGHCSHSFECERWKTGCGDCPRLDIPPAIRRDGTAFNWRRKRDIYRNSHLSLVCPSQWLADKVRQSILMPGADRLKVIPNGVDTSVFKPGDKMAARTHLDWPRDAFIVMFAANGVRQSIWKDYPTMREAVRLAGEKALGRPIRFFAIGESAPAGQVGTVKIEFLPYRDSMAECYQAADTYLHAAKIDTFPTTILEALACGTPVLATAVGGIPEQIIEGQTGYLVPVGDASALAERLVRLAQSPELVRTMGAAAGKDAGYRFSSERMVADYIRLYQEMIEEKTITCEDM